MPENDGENDGQEATFAHYLQDMAVILNIETSTRNCSVALSKDDELLSWRESDQGNEHAARIAVFVSEVLQETGLRCGDIEAVAVGEGPGSYTGLRIGVSTAKGLAYALDRPLLRVSPLQAMAWEAARLVSEKEGGKGGFLFCPMTDAGRMEAYTAIYDADGQVLRAVAADIVDESSYQEFFSRGTLVFCGDGCAKCQELFKERDALFLPQIRPSARYMPALAAAAFARKEFEDVAYFEPFYLKDFVAGKPHVKGLD